VGEEAIMSEDGNGVRKIVYPLYETTPPPTGREWDVYDAIQAAERVPNGKALDAAIALKRKHGDEDLARMGGGDWSLLVRDRIIGAMAGPSHVARAALHAKFRLVVRELASPTPSAVEALLADAAALAWFDYLRCQFQAEMLVEPTFRRAEFYDRQVTRAHGRLLRSLKALAAVRRVDVSAIQINIGNLTQKLAPLLATVAAQPSLDADDQAGAQIEGVDDGRNPERH
jgi:hypothetical protein